MEQIKSTIINKLRKFFSDSGFNKAVLGMSGGIDSALVLALSVEALGKDNVLPVLMPSKFSSDHSVNDSLRMIEILQTQHHIIRINDIYDTVNKSLAPIFNGLPFDVTEENIQARIRGLLLMAISNKQRRLLLNTSNKSELSVGYGTMYGDLCGAISVIGDIYKTEVYQLSNYINKDKEIIPYNIINKVPSAELHPDQKDEDSLPPYDILDAILRLLVDKGLSKEEIKSQGFDADIVDRICHLYYSSRYKSKQLPPVLTIDKE